ncbi:hypothetical protein HXX76_001764 [Chlamydomonas incerta]|uniref:Cation/H+ exchanger transmembrane domain-containing protein n=1 Tax=Chlamydomonas incerta TaxID=51695 RepID=A0A835TQ83_CHLIN|nr:hypothetical protein HXX76_001764 [Chlamydomonas incerta]|eukprot:KAG2443406.1 hypothetical protein HXX76_001764 [Chlamydomonas incerta]
MDVPVDDAAAAVAEQAAEHAPASVAILIQLIVLAVAFVIGRALEKIKFQWMGEAGAALLLGLLVGLVMKAAGVGVNLASTVAFKGGIFFYVLLPTIMFDAGYSLDTRSFIKNVGSVCMYAFVGTTISCFTIGLMMWAFGVWGWCFKMPLLANLTFGALISATDPVTVLAVFQRLNAQPDLYMNVFGESVLNDAVGMVLFNVISAFLGGKDVSAGSVFAGIGLFVGIFVGSAVIGIAIGLLAALIFRSRYFYSGPVVVEQGLGNSSSAELEVAAPAGNSTFEVGLAVVFAYGSYLAADAAHCSGIVAVVVNGMVMNMYVRPNLSEAAEHKIETLFKTLAGLFELFVFSYIGSTMFLVDEEYDIAMYTILCLVALAVSRVFNILPCTAAINLLRPRERHIDNKQQFMMWWAGLRGAMAFALSVEASEKFGVYGRVMKTCTFYIIFLTVLVNGGTSAAMLQRLRLRAEDTPALLLNYKDSHANLEAFGNERPGFGDGDSEEGEEVKGGRGPLGRRRGSRLSTTEPEDEGDDEEEARTEGGDRFGDSDGDGTLGGKPRHAKSASAAAAAFAAAGSPGSRSLRQSLATSLKRPSVLLERVRSLNDGRLVDKFDAFDRKMSKVLIHPDARREAELTAAAAAAAGSGGHSHQHPHSHQGTPHAPHDTVAHAAHVAHAHAAHGYSQPPSGAGKGSTHDNPGKLFATPVPSAPDLERWFTKGSGAGGAAAVTGPSSQQPGGGSGIAAGGAAAAGGAPGLSGQVQQGGQGGGEDANGGGGGAGGDLGESFGSGRSVSSSGSGGRGAAKIGPAASFGRVAWKGMDASARDGGSGSGSGRMAFQLANASAALPRAPGSAGDATGAATATAAATPAAAAARADKSDGGAAV